MVLMVVPWMILVKIEANWWGQQKDVGSKSALKYKKEKEKKKKKKKKKEINTMSHASCNQIKKLTQFLWWEGDLG